MQKTSIICSLKNMVLLLGFLTGLLNAANAQSTVEYQIVVAKDNSGDYTSIQDAVNSTKAFPDKRITIVIRNGVYHEKVTIPSWNNLLSLRGESREGTIITYDDSFDRIALGRNSTFYTSTLKVEANDFVAENLTIENSAGPVGQAIALSVTGDRCVFVNCSIKGNQDTLYVAGENARQYFLQCTIEGTTDFIFGEAKAVFDRCVIRPKSNSYITAASTPKDSAYGLVFMDCRIENAANLHEVYLGRPWRPYAQTVFLRCAMDESIRPEGWHNWSKPEAEKTVFYAEYDCYGAGSNPSQRVEWAHRLSRHEAKRYRLYEIFSGNMIGGSHERWYLCESCMNSKEPNE